MSGKGVVEQFRKSGATVTREARPRFYLLEMGFRRIALFAAVVFAGTAVVGLFGVPIKSLIVSPLQSVSDVPGFAGIRPHLVAPDGTDPSLLRQKAPNDATSLTASELQACDAAAHRSAMAYGESVNLTMDEMIADKDMSSPKLYALQLSPHQMGDIAAASGDIRCYASLRPQRLCAEADRAHFAMLAAVVAATYDSAMEQIVAEEAYKVSYSKAPAGGKGKQGTTIVDGIFNGFRASLTKARDATVASMQTIAAYMPPESYTAALGDRMPATLASWIADVRPALSLCKQN